MPTPKWLMFKWSDKGFKTAVITMSHDIKENTLRVNEKIQNYKNIELFKNNQMIILGWKITLEIKLFLLDGLSNRIKMTRGKKQWNYPILWIERRKYWEWTDSQEPMLTIKRSENMCHWNPRRRLEQGRNEYLKVEGWKVESFPNVIKTVKKFIELRLNTKKTMSKHIMFQ